MGLRVLIVTCVFSPEPVTSAQTSAQVVDELVKNGHAVTVITNFPNRPEGRLYSGYSGRLFQRVKPSHGYELIRCYSTFSRESRLLSRFLENFTFGLTSSWAVLMARRADVVYANTWPIFAQGLLMWVCKARHLPLVLSVQDLYPESLFVQKRGLKKNSCLYALLRRLDIWIARSCKKLIVVSERFKEIYVVNRQIPEDKITVIPNWIDDTLPVMVSNEDIRKKNNIPADAFLVVYGGNIGMAAGVENIIHTFRHLSAQKNIYLLLAGAGSSLSNCLELLEKYQLERVKIHSPWLTSETLAVLNAADLCILPTQGEQSLVSVPSKLLFYMLAGRCVLTLADPQSEIVSVITASQAGWVIAPGDFNALANCIVEISKLSVEERDRRGQAGRDFVLNHFSISKNLSKVVGLLVESGKAL